MLFPLPHTVYAARLRISKPMPPLRKRADRAMPAHSHGTEPSPVCGAVTARAAQELYIQKRGNTPKMLTSLPSASDVQRRFPAPFTRPNHRSARWSAADLTSALGKKIHDCAGHPRRIRNGRPKRTERDPRRTIQPQSSPTVPKNFPSPPVSTIPIASIPCRLIVGDGGSREFAAYHAKTGIVDKQQAA